MQRVFVLDHTKQPLMPCHPARARQLLTRAQAAVYRHHPFTIILKRRRNGITQPVTVKIDPGSRITGIALIGDFQRSRRLLWAADLHHRGNIVVSKLLKRKNVRRSRRNRKNRYRPPRFANRFRPKGWLVPSLRSRVGNIETWVELLRRRCPITGISLELNKFDTQRIQNSEISGVEYKQGTLAGYEVRQYLLEKWMHRCAYCDAEKVPLEVEHIVPKRRGGSDRVSNLTIACRTCNMAKANQTAAEFGFPEIQTQAQNPQHNAAVVNATRWAIHRVLTSTKLPLEVGTGGRTKFNRTRQGYPKTHWLDATCVGESGTTVYVTPRHIPLIIRAMGRGSRQMCLMDRYGFPRTRPKQKKRVKGFQTGDLVRAKVPRGKYTGVRVGHIAVRTRGSFRMGQVDGISWQHCQLLQRADGYRYEVEPHCQRL